MTKKNRLDVILFTRYQTNTLPDLLFSKMKEVFEKQCLDKGCRVLRFKKETEFVQLRIKKKDDQKIEEIIAMLKSLEGEWSEHAYFWGNHYAFASKIKAS